MNKEIINETMECLFNSIKAKDKIIDEQVLEISQLKNKINEAIEYIRSNEWAKDYEISNCRTHLLEILGDKENEIN